ncbi:MAG: SDR family oxidoreductase [Sedimentisphaerales bacterium]|nr:SDR family oxidoreductase [Sedimentisphaerales bacterium]
MARDLRDNVAIVTGASQGIGKAISLELAKAGANVVLAARSRDALEELAAQINRLKKDTALAVPTDVASEESIRNLLAAVEEHWGRMDILVNNAGRTLSRPLAETTSADWDRLMAVNARGAFLLCRESLALLRRSERAHIVNISSVVGVKGYTRQIAYTASKHALRGMSIALAEELRDTNIRVHVICPGGVLTEMTDSVRPDIPKDELILPEEIADWVLHLLRQEGRGVVDEIRIRRASSGPWF